MKSIPLKISWILAFAVPFLFGCQNASEHETEPLEEEVQTIEVEEVAERYGLPEESFKIYEGRIKKNQFLADILLGYGVPYTSISALADVAKDVHDVRKLREGEHYAMFCTKDSLETACYFVVETSADTYVVYQLNDSISAYIGKKPLEIKIREVGGVINSSLSQTISENELSPVLANKLSEIYAWTVDFYRIQRGDYFKAVFEEIYVDGERIGIGNILAAKFVHRDQPFYSYRFVQDSVANFFDENGESLRKAFLKAPLQFSRISSRYTKRRFHPVQKRWKAHLGTDYAAPSGTPILATGDGTVIESAYGKANGNYVKIRHNSTYSTQYLHMSRRKSKKGDFVRQGDVIGYVGATGLATGPHVCYRFWKNGQQVDPYSQDLPPSEPINPEYLEQYNAVKDSLMPILKNIEIRNDEVGVEDV